MKKKYRVFFAISLAVVGCQDYEDDLETLNSQIASLSSQLDGVVSDYALLKDKVNPLEAQIESIEAQVKAYRLALFLIKWPCLVSITISAASKSFSAFPNVVFEEKPRSFISVQAGHKSPLFPPLNWNAISFSNLIALPLRLI